MSLLLEALKKAEKAKEEAQRRARGESEPAASAPPPSGASLPPSAPARAGAPLALEGETAPEPEPKRVLTRSELPDINQPLSIEGADLAPSSPTKAPPPARGPREELKLETPKEAPRRPAATVAAAQAAEREAEKNTARKVFEAKFREPNPKLPFYITLGVLGSFAVGIVVYFYIQLRPPYPLVNSNPPRPSVEAPVAAAAPAPPAPVPGAAPSSAIPGLPGTPPAAPAPSPTPAVPRLQAAAPAAAGPERPLLSPAPRLASPSVNASRQPGAQQSAPGPEVTVNRAAAQLSPKVESGYAAYQAGDLAKARADYEQALADDATNRDALLGLAAIETRSGRYDAAETDYLRLLQLDPRDANAQAGLLALRAARQDPLASESRVKSLLAQAPGAHVLNFTLGNQFAQQGRWAEAQQEYFKAFAGDPENADFAYNLAVSLDHLRQTRLAREYYLRAVTLAEKRSSSFDPAAARVRADQLGN